MASAIGFETPENVEIQYQAAGLGHRYIAYLVDMVVIIVPFVIVFLFNLFYFGAYFERQVQAMQMDPEEAEKLMIYIIVNLLASFTAVSVLYFLLCEFLLRGQTVGKRVIGLRIVKTNGFSLDSVSIFLRNIFRLIDQFSPLWIVPVLSRRSQRLGDMVAGTVVVFDKPERLSLVREELAGRAAADARFRFDAAALGRLRPVDFETVELLLDRWDDIKQSQLVQFLDTMLDPLARRLRVESPAPADRLAFLEDLLAAEYRRQSRSLA